MQFSIKNPASANAVGVGLRHPHHKYVIDKKPKVSWFEVHSENFFAKGGPSVNFLTKVRENYPISLHGVGLSLGSSTKLSKKHLQQIKDLSKIIDPFLVSDHISWSNAKEGTLNDLLPFPYTKESLKNLCDNVSQAQDFLGREILIENPSTYLSFKTSEFSEEELINETARITGCKILLDINNIYVSSKNNIFDAKKYIKNINKNIVAEMHLAGHSKREIEGKSILVDTHNDFVCNEVWDLYEIAAKKFNNAPTLIEWDQDIPEFNSLLSEVRKAEKIIKMVNS